MINPYNILRHEFTGLPVRITSATHEGYKCAGIVADETRDTIKIKTEAGIKTLPKDSITLEVTLPQGEIVQINGALLLSRPEERIKKKYRIKFV
jgi:ribonuclease P protein subunit POP4